MFMLSKRALVIICGLCIPFVMHAQKPGEVIEEDPEMVGGERAVRDPLLRVAAVPLVPGQQLYSAGVQALFDPLLLFEPGGDEKNPG